MSELSGILGQVLAEVMGHPLVGILLQGLAAALVVLWLAAAWWAWRDLADRTDEPVAPYVAAAGVLLATPLFFPLALVVYRLVRPQEPAVTADSLTLRALALTAGPPEAACPSCGLAADPAWRRCPRCGSALSAPCPACDGPTRPDWTICAWCAADLPSA
jgi:hypothetical protein